MLHFAFFTVLISRYVTLCARMQDDLKVLIKKAQDGDKESFGKLYKEYYKKIYRYCSFNCYDALVAEDICQETFVKAWKNLKSFKTDQENWSLQAFLFKIARNLIIDRSREKRNVSIEDHEEIEEVIDLYGDFDRQNDVNKVRRAISKLEELERQIVVLRFFEELDSKEVAKILHINDGALRVRQGSIMQKLIDIIEALYGNRN